MVWSGRERAPGPGMRPRVERSERRSVSLRVRLVLLYLLLAVVPLAGLTVYSYVSSERALQQAVAAEGRAMASDMTRRLERASADLGRRLERAGRLPFAPEAAGADAAPREDRVVAYVRDALGEWSDLVESLEVVPEPPPAPLAPTPDSAVPLGGDAPTSLSPEVGEVAAESGPTQIPWGQLFRGEPLTPEQERALEETAARHAVAFGAKLEKQMKQIEREIQEAPDPEEKAIELGRRAAMVAGRTLGELVRRSAEIRDLLRHEVDVEVVHDGRALGTLQARVRGRRLIERILNRTPRNRGEIPFALDSESALHSASADDGSRLAELGVPGILDAAGESQVLRTQEDWVVVTHRDPETGLTLGIARPIGASLRELRVTALRNLGWGLAIAALACAGIVPISRRVTRNLASLSDGAERLARGELDARVPVRSRDEFGRLAETFNQMATSLCEQQRELVERERLRKELEMSRRIQVELLPREPLRLDFAEVCGISVPAREVGGDFFNYFTLPSGDLAVLVGDVSGKGVPAALLAANLQASLRARLPLESDLTSLATSLDEQVDENTPGSVYATLFMAVLDPSRKVMRWINAGHNPQFLLRAGGGAEPLGPGGRPLGLLPGGGFEGEERTVAEGDALFLYTDGLIDSENARGDLFGMERLEALLRDAGPASPQELLSRVERAAVEFRDGVEAGDDATLVMLRLSPTRAAGTT